jgi:hypothetical protein
MLISHCTAAAAAQQHVAFHGWLQPTTGFGNHVTVATNQTLIEVELGTC